MGRMWIVLEIVIMAGIALLAITEFFYPLIAGKPLFGSFRKRQSLPPEPTLDDEIAEARRKASEVKEVQRKADQRFREAGERKDQADDLLN